MAIVKIVAAIFLIVAAGWLQNSGLVNAFGINPNLILVILISLAFAVNSFPLYFFFASLGVALARFQAGFETEAVILAAVLLVAYFLSRRLPWLGVVNNMVLISGGTLIFYLLNDPSFLFSDWSTVAGEIVYNSVIGTFLFLSWGKTN